MQDLSSSTRDRTHTPWSGSLKHRSAREVTDFNLNSHIKEHTGKSEKWVARSIATMQEEGQVKGPGP